MFGTEVKKINIDKHAVFQGNTQIKGTATRIGAGALIKNSYLKNIIVKPGAKIVDSVITNNIEKKNNSEAVSAGKSFLSRWNGVSPTIPTIGEKASVFSSTLENSSVDVCSKCNNSSLYNCSIGSENKIADLYGNSVYSLNNVTISGPTEVCGAWLGHHTLIDKIGFYEGIFANDFYILEYDHFKKDLLVKEILDIPHLSKYGMNTIISSNSGKILPQPDNKFKSFGKHKHLWYDNLLSHEPVMLGPCAVVAGWTKVIGKSAVRHKNATEFIKDNLATYIMPFSVSALTSDAVKAQIISGELNNGSNYRNRYPGWIFTASPAFIMETVKKLTLIMNNQEIADNIIKLTLKNILAILQYQAANANKRFKERQGWKDWYLSAIKTIKEQLTSGRWNFKNGIPLNWQKRQNKWFPDAAVFSNKYTEKMLHDQYSITDLLKCNQQPLQRETGIKKKLLAPTTRQTYISRQARISANAHIGPGVQIKGKSVIEDNVYLYRAIIDNSTIKKNCRVWRSVIKKSTVDKNTILKAVHMDKGKIGSDSKAVSAQILNSSISRRTTIYPFAKIFNSTLKHPSIIGSTLTNVIVNTIFMSYHMPGQVENLRVIPAQLEWKGKKVYVKAVPMLGGGLRITGRLQKPVITECAFIGSNTVIENGAYIGFGAFVLGRLTEAEGLLPFTISTSSGSEKDQIGGVVSRLANIVITHFINWTYQANNISDAEKTGKLITAKLKEGKNAVLWAQQLRKSGQNWDTQSCYAKYKSLKLYTDQQLLSGLTVYNEALSDDRWQMRLINNQLSFCSRTGFWHVTNGTAKWQKNYKSASN
ncbi:MAG TPA: hypothetical protein VKS21_07440 [Spirochaetota bacterium]|nr:hypothetical protein [Spirochaetota bacterium]